MARSARHENHDAAGQTFGVARSRRNLSWRAERAIHLVCAFGLAFSPVPGRATEAGGAQLLDAIQQQVLELFEKCRSAVVRIEGADSDGRLFGSGFFIDPNGTLYTSYSVGGETHDLVVIHGEAKYPARRLIADARTGIAILKVDAQTPFLSFGSSRDLRTASPVMAIGYPMDLSITPSFGIVGGFDIRYLGRIFATAHIRANVPVQRGQGGAPLLNMKGEAVGLLISSIDNGSATFALPIEAAQKVRRDYLRYDRVRPGWMGIAVQPRDLAHPESSLPVIETLIANSPGASSGLRPGDTVVQLGDRVITTEDDVLAESFYLTADEEVTLAVLRDGARLEVNVRPIDHPQLQSAPTLPMLGASDLRLEATER
jgi:serine protease Do